MGRFYWFILEEEPEKKRFFILDDKFAKKNYSDETEWVYIVHRDAINDIFVFKTRELAIKCKNRLNSLHPDEPSCYITKKSVRTEYR